MEGEGEEREELKDMREGRIHRGKGEDGKERPRKGKRLQYRMSVREEERVEGTGIGKDRGGVEGEGEEREMVRVQTKGRISYKG